MIIIIAVISIEPYLTDKGEHTRWTKDGGGGGGRLFNLQDSCLCMLMAVGMQYGLPELRWQESVCGLDSKCVWLDGKSVWPRW